MALNIAIDTAGRFGHTYVGSEHLLLGLLKEGSGAAAMILKQAGISEENVATIIMSSIGRGNPTLLTPDHFTPRAKRVIESAIREAGAEQKSYVGTEHLLIGILSDSDNYATRFIIELGGNLQNILTEAVETSYGEPRSSSNKKQNNKEKTSTPTLEKFGRDLTKEAREGKLDPVIGRSKEIERVVQILCRRTKNNPCLIGEPGVGKTAIAEGLAQKIASDDAPEILRNKRVISLDLTGMVAGTKYRGDFEERIKTAIDEVKNATDVILFIDEVHTLIGAGSAEGSTDAANILKPSLARGDLQVIGATTLDEYRKNIEKDAALERRFQPVTVGEPTSADAELILKGLRDKYEAHHKVKITDGAISAAVKLSSRYIADRYLPDKAIDLIDEAASRVRLRAYTAPSDLKDKEAEIKRISEEKNEAIRSQQFEQAAKLRDTEKRLQNELNEAKREWEDKNTHFSGIVNEEEIAAIVSDWTGVPVSQLTEEESARLLNMESVLHARIVGQEVAVSAVSKAIRRGRVGLKDPKRPIGSFIFLGPTGVGKTELCKALAEAMFGDENAMIRLDMSEYMEQHTVSKMIGSPPGYVGFDEGGQLTELVRRKPYSVILFDEIEKAHSDVFNVLLQILDDGVLTDSQGRKINFKNTVVIMTSNVGARFITEKRTAFGFADSVTSDGDERAKNEVLAELRRTFKPEFLNRVDDIIVFNKLTEDNILSIAEKMLDTLKQRLQSLGITISFDKSAIKAVAKAGFDEVYGARPLRRAIQSKIEDKLSELMLQGTIKKGDRVICGYENEDYKFIKE